MSKKRQPRKKKTSTNKFLHRVKPMGFGVESIDSSMKRAYRKVLMDKLEKINNYQVDSISTNDFLKLKHILLEIVNRPPEKLEEYKKFISQTNELVKGNLKPENYHFKTIPKPLEIIPDSILFTHKHLLTDFQDAAHLLKVAKQYDKDLDFVNSVAIEINSDLSGLSKQYGADFLEGFLFDTMALLINYESHREWLGQSISKAGVSDAEFDKSLINGIKLISATNAVTSRRICSIF